MPGTFERLVEARLQEMSYSAEDIPPRFYLLLNITSENVQNFVRGELAGLKGISGSFKPAMQAFRSKKSERNAIISMPGPAVLARNKLSRFMYDNPDYWFSRDMAAFKRVSGNAPMTMWLTNIPLHNVREWVSPAAQALLELLYDDWQSYDKERFCWLGGNMAPTCNNVADVAKWMSRTVLAALAAGKVSRSYKEVDPKIFDWKVFNELIRNGTPRFLASWKWNTEKEWVVKTPSFHIPPGSLIYIRDSEKDADWVPELASQYVLKFI